MGRIDTRIYEMLKTKAASEKAKALLTLELLNTQPAGIGDHSTGDFYKNAEEALMMLVDANDKLETLEGLYANSQYKG
tara:strand:+ start:505 stop:738 length:234 start_codon:yes stop_codon:yes gene_type:complete